MESSAFPERVFRRAASTRDAAKQPAVIYVLAAVLSLMGLLFLFGGMLNWRGWDIDLDSKTRKFSIKRFGTGR
jgi:hypothetical protein